MRLLIKFPTRSRRETYLKVVQKYRSFASNKSTKIVTIIDEDDQGMVTSPRFLQDETVIIPPQGKIGAINAPLPDHLEYDILLLASDDMVPMVYGYDQIIIDDMKRLYPDGDGVLWYNDGYTGNRLNTLVCAGRKYLDSQGYIYHPDYKSLWCDNEFMDVARGKMTYIDNVIIKHDHPMNKGYQMDRLYRINEAFYKQDEQTYLKRKAAGFPKESIYATA